ncbi:MAG: carbon-nitrogen hydrolase family protein [Oceanococcaceae bacterium]
MLRVAAIQMNSGPDPQANLQHLSELLQRAQQHGAQMAVLPENVLIMGARATDKYASADAAPHWVWRDRVLALGRAQNIGLVAGSLYCRDAVVAPAADAPPSAAEDPRVLSRCWVMAADGHICGHYDKRHLFDVEAAHGESYRESQSIRPGSNPPRTVDCAGWRWGLSICYDLRFAEHYLPLARAGAQILTVPSAFTHTTGQAHWEVLLRARAIENQCFVVAANQCGTHPGGRQTWGRSMIIDPWGRILAQADDDPGVITADLDPTAITELRQRFPVHDHRLHLPEDCS